MDRVIHMAYTITVSLANNNIGHQGWKKYKSKHGGRKMFQIDLGLSLINYGIENDWGIEKEEKSKPIWIRQANFVPCECKKCFFCLNGLTVGINHKTNIYETKGGKKKLKGCSNERVKISEKSVYCRQCYRKQPLNISTKQKKENCKFSKMGCIKCKEPICKDCWQMGYDGHNT